MRSGQQYANPDHTEGADALIAIRPPEGALAWATHEVLNFVRVAKRIDYSPRSYLRGDEPEPLQEMKGIPLPPGV